MAVYPFLCTERKVPCIPPPLQLPVPPQLNPPQLTPLQLQSPPQFSPPFPMPFFMSQVFSNSRKILRTKNSNFVLNPSLLTFLVKMIPL